MWQGLGFLVGHPHHIQYRHLKEEVFPLRKIDSGETSLIRQNQKILISKYLLIRHYFKWARITNFGNLKSKSAKDESKTNPTCAFPDDLEGTWEDYILKAYALGSRTVGNSLQISRPTQCWVHVYMCIVIQARVHGGSVGSWWHDSGFFLEENDQFGPQWKQVNTSKTWYIK